MRFILSLLLLGNALLTNAGMAEAPQSVRDDEARRARVIYGVKGAWSLTVGEVEDAIHERPAFERARYRDPKMLGALARSLIDQKLLAQRARLAHGREPTAERGLKELLIQKLLRGEVDRRVSLESIADSDVSHYYQHHTSEFHRPEERRAHHILVVDRRKALELLDDARRVDMHGFQELAKQHSADPKTQQRGGDLGYFFRTGEGNGNPPSPALRQAVFGLSDIGDVYERPIHVGNGWSVVKLTGLRPAEHQSLVEAEPAIRRLLWQERRAQAIGAYLRKLWRQYDPQLRQAP
ncbi:MAG: peptidyl-prolyl cis-trans isomerase [Myxococcales bacterium]|nr:peptidyl-prolyl cis-trans isomerase [Myxococcales bacterium]